MQRSSNTHVASSPENPGRFILTRAGIQRGLPRLITVDHGTEFTSRALDHWAWINRVKLDPIRPGKPTDNSFIESFNARAREECLSQHYFSSIAEARQVLAAWREDYNHERPHSSLGQQTPAQVGARARTAMTRESGAIEIAALRPSCEAVLEPTEVAITEDRKQPALRRA